MTHGFFGQYLLKRDLKQKEEHHHQILHIQVSLGFKFQLQQTILVF